MPESYCMVLTTTDSKTEADKLAEQLVMGKLAACVQIIPITSYYIWQGSMNKDAELLLLIKTTYEHYSEIEKFIQQHHSYETPEIIQIPIENGSSDYLGWISEQTEQ